MKLINMIWFIVILIQEFLVISINLRKSQSISIEEELLLKKYENEIKDSRQRKLFLEKLRKKVFNYNRQDIFFSSYTDQMNEYSVYSKKSSDYENFKYLVYDDIVQQLNKFSKTYSELIEVNTSQKLYDIPNPIGNCGNKSCENFILHIGNKAKRTSETPQLYISCAMHGDEKIGPTLCIEFVDLLLSNYRKHKWITFLLDNRLIIMTPMTNAYGYYMGEREETVDRSVDNNISIDPNRDFPILKRYTECMQTITARTVNEIFLRHLVRFSISIHGGTSSLTYPWGIPSHLVGDVFKIDRKSAKIDSYYSGLLDSAPGDTPSYSAPDASGFQSIANILSINSNPNKNFQYPTGDMNTKVYPVRGAFEDWAYSGSWEGYPSVIQPCQPKTYNGYNSTQSNYNTTLKAFSLLLETSDNKSPAEFNLGVRKTDCLLNIISNPFIYEKDESVEKECLSNNFNGYISKNIRLLLIAVDLVQPYINLYYSYVKNKRDTQYLSLKWIVGGAYKVDETFIIYDTDSNEDFENYFYKMKLNGFKNFSFSNISNADSNTYQPKFTNPKKGNAIWKINPDEESFIFEDIVKLKPNAGSKIKFVILAMVDQNFKILQGNPDPKTAPKSHLINERINPDYYADNNGYEIRGKKYFHYGIVYKPIVLN